MNENNEVSQNPEKLKKEITEGMNNLLMGLVFDRTSRAIKKITQSADEPHPYYTVIVFALIVPIPGLLVALLFKETKYFWEYGIVGLLLLELTVAGMVAAKLNINYVLTNLKDHIVDAIELEKDLNDLREWLDSLWELQKQILFCSSFGIVIGTICIIYFSNVEGEFVGIGLTIFSLLIWMFASVPVYYIFRMVSLPRRLSQYQFTLFETHPNHSDVMRHLSLMLKEYTRVVAIFIATYTFCCSFYPPFQSINIIILAAGWVPLTIQFISNRAAQRQIVRNVKWKTLKEIEEKIKAIQLKANLAEKESIESIIRLMDFHDRISTSHDSGLDFRSRLEFLSQISLTLLAYLLANIDKVAALFQ